MNNYRDAPLREHTTNLKAENGKFYFLGIGINEYKYHDNLSTPVNDVTKLKELLINQYQFKEENVECLFNDKAKIFRIRQLLYEFNNRIEEEDSLVVYFAGHGTLDLQKDGFWIPSDANKEEYAKYIEYDSIKSFLKKSRAKHILLLSDSCFSNRIFDSTRSAIIPNPSNSANEVQVQQFKSRWALTAGHELVEDGKSHSPFAEAIITYLGKNTGNSIITVSKLGAFVRDTVAKNANQLPQGGPLSGVGDQGGEFVFIPKENDLEEWDKLQKNKSIQGYYRFVRKFPKSTKAKNAYEIIDKYEEERTNWISLNKSHHNALKLFLEDFEDGYFEEDAIQQEEKFGKRIKNLTKKDREENDWQITVKKNDINAFLEFEKEHPDGKYFKEAQARRRILEKNREEDIFWDKQKELFKRPNEPRYKRIAYQDYLEKYPHGNYSETAERDVTDIKFYEEQEPKGLEGFKEYLKYYPSGIFSERAKNNVKKLEAIENEDEAAFGNARRVNTRKAYRFYLSNFDKGNYIVIAKEAIEKLDKEDNDFFERVKAKGVLKGYKEYYNFYEHKDGIHLSFAKTEIERLTKKDNTAFELAEKDGSRSAYQKYLQEFPDGLHVTAANDAILKLEEADENAFWAAWETEEIAPLESYLIDYEDGKFKHDAVQKIKELKNAKEKQQIEAENKQVKSKETIPNLPLDGIKEETNENSVSNFQDNTGQKSKVIKLDSSQPNSSSEKPVNESEQQDVEATVPQMEELVLLEDSAEEVISPTNESPIENARTELQLSLSPLPVLKQSGESELTSEEYDRYQNALKVNKVVTYQQFLQDFPNSLHHLHITERIRKLKLKRVRTTILLILFSLICLFLFFNWFRNSTTFKSENLQKEKPSNLSQKEVKKTGNSEDLLKDKIVVSISSDTLLATEENPTDEVAIPIISYHIIVESFKEEVRAKQFLYNLKTIGYDRAQILRGDYFYFVSAEQFSNELEADNQMKILSKQHNGAWVKQWKN